ncbi:cysteine-rich receptor-like protein kinase 44 isoform X2 [Magnolia sinica]|nr:cysteine-rich receptor-like protein kinase 44 isoform X2 [Magnolia sinica]XP_058097847.1 cysteine-rich receptor-like protein kinase 44 isoform X2 [Magnolia sinica]
MSLEYAMDGLFSVKSDVFIFGVLLLEIINGKRNNDCFRDDPSQNLVRYRDNSELVETDGWKDISIATPLTSCSIENLKEAPELMERDFMSQIIQRYLLDSFDYTTDLKYLLKSTYI